MLNTFITVQRIQFKHIPAFVVPVDIALMSFGAKRH